MADITGESWRAFMIVAAALLVVLNSILSFAKNWRDLRKPNADVSKWRTETDQKLDRDNKRITALEEGNKALCQGMLALLNHEITGNSVDRLREAQQKMQSYLINR